MAGGYASKHRNGEHSKIEWSIIRGNNRQTNEIVIRRKMRVQYANVTSRTIRIGSDLERRMMEEHIIQDMRKQLLSAINSYLVDSGVWYEFISLKFDLSSFV